jgi:hypothetical protein
MVNFKKIVAVLCSATMIVAAPITAFAEDTPAVIAPGTGNIVAYSATTVTVPTTVKVSFNPQEWTIYRDADDTSAITDQIVSLNYAVSSMATMDRKITVSFTAAAPGTAVDGKLPVQFVDTADEAAPKTDENPDGAARNELKMYLAVVGAEDKVTTSRTDNTAFAIDTSQTSGTNITGALLADVLMTAKTTGAQVFKTTTGDSGTATKADIAFKLGKGAYELKSDAHPTFATDQAAFAAMVQPETLGDIVGFTFTGAMNTDADWTKADLTAIAITPTYEVEEADGEETAVTGGGYNQIIAGEVPPTSVTVTYDSTNLRYEIALDAGLASSVSDITNLKVNGSAATASNINNAGTMLRVSRDNVKAALGTEAWNAVTATGNLTFTFTIGDVDYTGTVVRN